MFNIIKADIYKIVKGNNLVYTIFGLICIGFFLGYGFNTMTFKEAVLEGLMAGSIFVPLFMVNIFHIMLSQDYSYRTIINSIVLGKNRKQLFVEKLLLSYLLTAFFFLLFVVSVICSAAFSTSASIIPEIPNIIKLFFLQLFLYLCICSFGFSLFIHIKVPYISATVFAAFVFMGEGLLSTIIVTFLPKVQIIMDTFMFENIRRLTNENGIGIKSLWIAIVSAFFYSIFVISSSYKKFSTEDIR